MVQYYNQAYKIIVFYEENFRLIIVVSSNIGVRTVLVYILIAYRYYLYQESVSNFDNIEYAYIFNMSQNILCGFFSIFGLIFIFDC